MSVTRYLDSVANDIHAPARLKGKPQQGVAGIECRLAQVIRAIHLGQTKDCSASLSITRGMIQKLPPEEKERLGAHTLLLQRHLKYYNELCDLEWGKIEEHVGKAQDAEPYGMQVEALKDIKAALKLMPRGEFGRVAFDALGKDMHFVIWGLEDYFTDVMRHFDESYKYAKELGYYLHVLNQELSEIQKLVPEEPEFERLNGILEDVEVFLEGRSELMSSKKAEITEGEFKSRLPEPHWTARMWESEAFQGAVLMGFSLMLAGSFYAEGNPVKLVDEKDKQRFCTAIEDKFSSIRIPSFIGNYTKNRPQLEKALKEVGTRYTSQPNAEVRQSLCDKFRRTGHI